MTTWAAYESPAPKAIRRAVSPLRASPSSIIRSSASGTDAAEVLPWSAMSRAIRTVLGSFIDRAIASMMRMLAWSMKLPERVRIARDIAEQGNTSAASIPLALERMIAEGDAKSGDTALLIAFGAGLAYAAQVVVVP